MEHAQLPNRPKAKLPPIHKGTRIQKRPIPRRLPTSTTTATFDADGYRSPASSPSQKCIYVSTKSPFMGIVKRVRKALDAAGASARGGSRGNQTLAARVAAMKADTGDGAGGSGRVGGQEVLVLGTGRAIEKTLNVAAWFDGQKDCRVSLRTRTVGAVDDIVVTGEVGGDEEDAGEGGDGREEVEDQARVRMVSCLEVVIGLR